uniref:Zn(2)-C6 fungal-type domain-containing protein n=1 Tax=Schizophyllum commune (strain H4-8 / FGSC 9210) TaxID=578458 RepID=D8PMZ9_SCHCM
MDPNSPDSSSEGKKRKKSACDYCKSKRVICHPQPDGKPCPRCAEKGVECTTTIAPKRTRGKGKKTLMKEAAAAGLTIPTPEPRSSSRRAEPIPGPSSALVIRGDSPEPPPLILPSTLVQDALESTHTHLDVRIAPRLRPQPVFTRFPPAQNPLFSTETLRAALEEVGWDPARLDPSRRVLTHCILAFSSLVSVDPYFVGCDAQGGRFPDRLVQWDPLNLNTRSNLDSTLGGVDVAELGRRRRDISRRLHEEALRLARKEGIATHASMDNVASCFLLDCIENPDDPADRMGWAAAYVWQFRSLAELGKLDWQHSITTLNGHIVRLQWRGSLMVLALHALTIDRTLPSASDEEIICGPVSTTFEDALARASSLTPDAAVVLLMNSAARRRPLDEVAALQMISAMELFQASASRFRAYILSLGNHPELRVGLHACAHALGTLAVSLYRALQARTVDSAVRDPAGAARLAAQRRAAKAIAVRAVVKGSVDVRRAMSPYRLRFKQFSGLDSWAEVLIGDKSGAVSTDERAEALLLRDVVRFSSFAGVDMSATTKAINEELDVIRSASTTQIAEETPHTWEVDTPEAWRGLPMDMPVDDDIGAGLASLSTQQIPTDVSTFDRFANFWAIFHGGTGTDLSTVSAMDPLHPMDPMFMEGTYQSDEFMTGEGGQGY